mmetsp:Transcript_846/g.3338  ORF Transcript_846/g.3338 Transcript_846/m.3338 type:complete len:407 (+) Transcript_846:1132-2352(+)
MVFHHRQRQDSLDVALQHLHATQRAHVPHANGLIPAAAVQVFGIGGQDSDVILVAVENGHAVERRRVPNAHGGVVRPGKHVVALVHRRRRQRAHRVAVSLQNAEGLQGARVPDPDGFVVRPAEQLPVHDRERAHGLGVSLQHLQRFQGVYVERAHGGVVRPAEQHVSGDGERAHGVGVAVKRLDASIRGQIPDANGTVVRSAEQLLVLIADRQRKHRSGMFLEHVQTPPGFRVPHSDGLVRAGAEKTAIRRLHRPHDLVVALDDAVRHRGGHRDPVFALRRVHHRLLHHARKLRGVQRDAVRVRPVLNGHAQREVGRELERAQLDARHGARLVSALKPALDARPVVRVAGDHHHRVHHELHGHRTREVRRDRDFRLTTVGRGGGRHRASDASRGTNDETTGWVDFS